MYFYSPIKPKKKQDTQIWNQPLSVWINKFHSQKTNNDIKWNIAYTTD